MDGGCACGGGRRTRKRTRTLKKKGGAVFGDLLLAGSALGLYSYFTRKRGGKQSKTRKTKLGLI